MNTMFFKESDFEGGGQYLIRMSPEEIACQKLGKKWQGYKDSGHLSTILYKVGFIVNNDSIGNGENLLCLISMSDGLTTYYHYPNAYKPMGSPGRFDKVYWQRTNGVSGDQIFAWYLNSRADEYRFASKKEVIQVISHQSSRWAAK